MTILARDCLVRENGFTIDQAVKVVLEEKDLR